MTPFVVADVGSTFLKIGLFDPEDPDPLPEAWRVTTIQLLDGALDEAAAEFAKTAAVWRVISVRRFAQERLAEWVRARTPGADYRVLAHSDIPLKTNVEHPDRVGVDRLAAAAAANVLRTPGRPAVVVDSGTAITVDLLDHDGVFQGGAILPGVRLTARALHSQTDALPNITLDAEAPPPEPCGRNTRAALESGLFWGVVGAVREIVAQLGRQSPEPPQVFLSGGDGKLIAKVFGDEAQFVPHLALRGAALASRTLV
jgi:type III pantothenate kinase